MDCFGILAESLWYTEFIIDQIREGPSWPNEIQSSSRRRRNAALNVLFVRWPRIAWTVALS